MANKGVFILIVLLKISQVVCQCTLPLADGDWISTSRGTWTVSGSGTQIANFQADLSLTINTATLTCAASGPTSDQFILSTNFELFFQVLIDVYTCIEIVGTDRAPFSYIYYIVTATDTTTGEQFTSDQSAACSNTGFRTPSNLNILTQSATVSNATRNFPDIILGNYSVVYENIDSAQETDWQMDSCVDTTLMSFTHANSTSRLGFTTTDAPNLLQCLYFVTEGSSVYAFLYNNGTQDGSTSYSYTCWVFALSGSNVVATAFPETCQETQTATSVQFGGEKFTFTPFFTCPLSTTTSEDEGSGLAVWIIVLIVLGILLFIAIIVVLIIYCYTRKSRVKDEEAGLVKGERRPSPDSLREVDIAEEKRKAQEEFKKETGRPFKKTKDEYHIEKGKYSQREKERTIDLIEVSKSKGDKLQDPRPAESDIQDKIKPEGIVKPKEITKTKGQTKQEKQKEEKKKEEEKKQVEEILKKKQEEDKKRQDERKEQEVALKQIIEPTGKQSIPPTTPKPECDETRLRIEKAREKKKREKEEKRRQEELRKKDALRKLQKVEDKPEERVYKTMRETSSSEETDESEREERRRKFNRLANSYDPIDKMVGDASVVGPKRRRKHKKFDDGGDTVGKLISREEDERIASEKRRRKKHLKRMAKTKVKGHDQPVTSDSESDTKGRKRRRAGDPKGIEAPHIEKYYHKKDIEEELDKIHYFDEPEEPQHVEEDALATPKPEQVSDQRGAEEEAITPSRMDIILQEEEYNADNIRVGPNDELPEGYLFDKDGNVIRESDGKIVMTHSQVEQRRKFGHVFSLPRLIRNEDGRPLGGYKDDEFGPTAEWDWGDAHDEKDIDTEKGKPEIPARTVAFSMKDELSSVPATPIDEMDASQRKGRQLGSADRELLKKRLFEQQQQRTKTEQPIPVPIYFSGSKGVVKDSAYIDNTQIEKQEPASVQRSQTVRNCSKANNMIFKSDTFDDSRPGRGKRQTTNSAFKRGGKLRATWTATSTDIPEETEVPTTQMPSRNIGSLDEFVLVGGSVSKLSAPNATRERSNISDINMRTAPDSPEALDDRKLRKYAGEFLNDKRFFDQYIETEKLPTNAAVETRALANAGLDYIHDRADFWKSKEPEPLRPPPSDLGLRLMRMSTFYTAADSGLDSRMSTMTSRPKSASDANNPNSSRLSQQENTTEPIPFRNQHQQYHQHISAPSDSHNQTNVQVVKVKPENGV